MPTSFRYSGRVLSRCTNFGFAVTTNGCEKLEFALERNDVGIVPYRDEGTIPDCNEDTNIGIKKPLLL